MIIEIVAVAGASVLGASAVVSLMVLHETRKKARGMARITNSLRR